MAHSFVMEPFESNYILFSITKATDTVLPVLPENIIYKHICKSYLNAENYFFFFRLTYTDKTRCMAMYIELTKEIKLTKEKPSKSYSFALKPQINSLSVEME